jgi:N-acetylgalactosamine kinase
MAVTICCDVLCCAVLQVAQLLCASQQELLQALPPGLQSAAAAANQLHLQQRACHVFTEAHRVLAFRRVCEDPQLSDDQKLQQLGELLNASHTSCSQLYQCSCEELDTLVGVARAAGALGARLTGMHMGKETCRSCRSIAFVCRKQQACLACSGLVKV